MNKSIFSGLIAVLILGLMSSCSKSGNLYDCVPADAMLVMSGSPEATLLNGGCTATSEGFEVSEAIDKILVSFSADDREAFTKLLNGSGIDFKRAVTVLDPANGRYFVTFMLDNKSNFRKWCEKQNFKTYGSAGYSVYSPKRDISIVVKDSQGWLVFGCDEGKEPEFVDALHEAAKDAPLPSWLEDKINDAQALGVALNIEKYIGFLASRSMTANLTLPTGNTSLLGYDAKALTHGYFVYDCTLNGVVARGKGSFYTADGEKIVNRAKIRPVNTSLLRYAKEDAAVMMFSLPDSVDWHQALEQINGSLAQAGVDLDAHMATMTASVLENIDHTIMLSGRVADMAALGSPQGWSGTVAVDFREGKAYEYSELIRAMADSFGFAPRNESDGSFSVTIPDSGLDIHIKVEGNTLIASSSPIQASGENATFTRAFDNTLGGMVLDISKDNALAQFVSLPFGMNITYTASAEKIVFDLSQTSAQGMLIDNFIKYFADRTVK